jgi:superfamily I DNA and/or RNA helicase
LLLDYLTKSYERLEIECTHTVWELTVGIISPYKQQVVLIKEMLKNYSLLMRYGTQISVNTVDGFQGQERDIVAISLVRSNDRNEIGFLKDLRRMNVALTRARKKLVVVGDSATLGSHHFYERWIQYTETAEAYHSAWEFLYD